jgi:hypothetical protein
MLLHKRRLLFDCCVFVLIVYLCQLCELQWLATELIQGSCCHCSLYTASPFKFKLSSSLWFLLRLLGLSSLSLTMALLSTSNVHSIVYCDLVNQSDQSRIFILSSSTVTILSSLLRRSKYIFNVERFIELIVKFDIYRWPRTLDRCEYDAHQSNTPSFGCPFSSPQRTRDRQDTPTTCSMSHSCFAAVRRGDVGWSLPLIRCRYHMNEALWGVRSRGNRNATSLILTRTYSYSPRYF